VLRGLAVRLPALAVRLPALAVRLPALAAVSRNLDGALQNRRAASPHPRAPLRAVVVRLHPLAVRLPAVAVRLHPLAVRSTNLVARSTNLAVRLPALGSVRRTSRSGSRNLEARLHDERAPSSRPLGPLRTLAVRLHPLAVRSTDASVRVHPRAWAERTVSVAERTLSVRYPHLSVRSTDASAGAPHLSVRSTDASAGVQHRRRWRSVCRPRPRGKLFDLRPGTSCAATRRRGEDREDEWALRAAARWPRSRSPLVLHVELVPFSSQSKGGERQWQRNTLRISSASCWT
jgi:hypothetical protein